MQLPYTSEIPINDILDCIFGLHTGGEGESQMNIVLQWKHPDFETKTFAYIDCDYDDTTHFAAMLGPNLNITDNSFVLTSCTQLPSFNWYVRN